MSSLFPPSSGPLLPSFNSLLIKGHYHPSAPFHLALSHTAQHVQVDARAIFLTSDRRRTQQALQDYNDNWLTINSGTGKTQDTASRIKLFYSPTPAHLCLLLTTLRVPQSSNDSHITSKIALECAPSMIILHELSWFFLPQEGGDDGCKWTISSYLTLLARTQALLSSFPESTPDGRGLRDPVAFAVFDSQLDQLMLPLIKQPSHIYGFIREMQPPPALEPVTKYLTKFFDWIGTVHEEIDEAPLEKRRKRWLNLCRMKDEFGPEISWHWQEVIGGGPEVKGILFAWDS